MDELIDKLNRLKIAAQYYDELAQAPIKDKLELENRQLKMQFTKKEMLLLLMEADKAINKNAE